MITYEKIKDFIKDCPATKDVLDFLIESKKSKVPICIYNHAFYLESLIVSKECLSKNYIDMLLDWNLGQVVCYGDGEYFNGTDIEYFLSEPCESKKPSEILSKATPIFFNRYNPFKSGFIYELNQKISHRLEIVECEKNQFYKKDKNGYKIEVASIKEEDDIFFGSLKSEDLNHYLNISNSILIRFFDIRVVTDDEDSSTHHKNSQDIIKLDDIDIYYKIFRNDIDPFHNDIRGFQIIYPDDEMEEKIDYPEFIVRDRDTRKVVTHSCDPGKLGNFFKPDDINEGSLVFFDSAVLNDYYSDSDKYIIDNGYIKCKENWSLKYGLSEDESQVIVTIKDLAMLLPKEIYHWKKYNEEPKSKIPNYLYDRIFLGKWSYNNDPAMELKDCLHNFPQCTIKGEKKSIWNKKNMNNIRNVDNIREIVTNKEKWEFEINKLNQLIIEGLDTNNIKEIAKNLGYSDEELKGLKGLKLLKKCIEKLYDEKTANSIVNPLFELNKSRNHIDHPTNKNIYPKDCNQDYKDMLLNCSSFMLWLSDKIKEGKFDID